MSRLTLLRHFGASLFGVALLVLAAAPPAAAQTTTGTIRGYVHDSSGAGLSEAQVDAINVSNGSTRSATTRSDGSYILVGLTPATYRLTVRHIGNGAQARLVEVAVGATVTADYVLGSQAVEVAGVEVRGAPPTIDTRTSEVGTNVQPQQIQNLPLSDRNFLDLASLAPGIEVLNNGLNNTVKTFAGGALPADNVNVFIDGASYKNDLTAGGVVGQDASRGNPFPLNAIQEFRVITQNYKAEYQKASSAIITATTKSGGNKWEGSLFFYGQGKSLIGTDSLPLKNPAVPSAGPATKPEYTRYQVGASVGGPLITDRLFFFGSYEGNYQNRASTVAFNADTAAPLGRYPALDSVNLSQYNGQFVSPFRSSLGFGKLTYVPSETHTLELSVNIRHETDIGSFGGVTSYLTAVNLRNNVNTIIATDRYSKGNWLNQAIISYQGYQRNPTPINPTVISRSYFDDAVCCTFIGQIGGAQSSQDYNQDRFSFRNDVTYLGWQWAGKHVVKAGANIDFARYHVNKDNNGNPLFTYFASDSFAFPHQATLGAGNPLFTTTNHEIGAYLQDDWSPTTRLMLNLGIRWDYESDMIDNSYVTPAFVRSALDTVVPANYFTDGTQRPPFYGAFQPRVGFSYAVDKAGRTTVFGGFGVYYDRDLYDNVSVIEQYNQQHPNYNFFFFTNPADSAAGKVRWNNSYLSKQGLLALLASGQTGKPELELVDDNTKPPRSNQWSMGIRQVLGENVLSATYTGVHSYNGFTYMCHNAFRTAGPGQPSQCFSSPAPTLVGNVFLSSDAVRTWYDAVFLQWQRPYSPERHWGAGISYTWAKGTQIGGDLFSFDYRFPTDYPRYQSPNVQRNTFVANWIADIPFVAVQFSGLLNLGSGVPYQTGGPESRAFPPKQNFILGHAFAFRDIDVRLRKSFPTFNGQGMDATLEVFNLFNYQNLGCWGGTTPNCIAYGSRRVQLGAGYTF